MKPVQIIPQMTQYPLRVLPLDELAMGLTWQGGEADVPYVVALVENDALYVTKLVRLDGGSYYVHLSGARGRELRPDMALREMSGHELVVMDVLS